MAVQTLPKVNVMQKAGTSSINGNSLHLVTHFSWNQVLTDSLNFAIVNSGNIQQQIVSGAQIVSAGSTTNQMAGEYAILHTIRSDQKAIADK